MVFSFSFRWKPPRAASLTARERKRHRERVIEYFGSAGNAVGRRKYDIDPPTKEADLP